jgi:hypothetical protein
MSHQDTSSVEVRSSETENSSSLTRIEPRVLRLEQIVLDDRFQFRPLDRGTVKKYASAYRADVTMPPVKVADLKGALILTDGWHRVAARESLGEQRVEAIVVPASSEKEVRWLAAQANLEHGLPLKPKQYREVFRAYIKARRHRNENGSFKSYRDIATELGGARGHTTIRNWMEKDFPGVYRAMGGRAEPVDFPEDDPEPEQTLAAVVLDALKAARAALPGVTDPNDLGDIVAELEAMMAVAKRWTWVPPANQGARRPAVPR